MNRRNASAVAKPSKKQTVTPRFSTIDSSVVLSRGSELIDTGGSVWTVAAKRKMNWALMPLAEGAVLTTVKEHIRNLLRTRSVDYACAQFRHLCSVFFCAKSLGLDVNVPETYDERFFVNIRQALHSMPLRHSRRRAISLDGEDPQSEAPSPSLPSKKTIKKGIVANFLDSYRRWLVFCADQEYDGFDQELATVLENYVIGGNQKGHAVMSDDPNEGPFRYLEMFALQSRIVAEMRVPPDSVDPLLVAWTYASFGIYPKAMQYLNEEDLICTSLQDGGVRYELRIPRLKKTDVNIRDEFHVRPVDSEIGKLFEWKIRENRDARTYVLLGHDSRKIQRPMFPDVRVDHELIGTSFEADAMRVRKSWFGEQLSAFVERAGILAEDGKPLRVTARRLRYSFATRLVQEGASLSELAQALDHSDLQNVMIYFNSRSDIVLKLDTVYALRLAPIAQTFMGTLIKSESEAVRGDDPASRIYFAETNEQQRKLTGCGSCGSFGFCGLHAHIACYTCFKFQAWLDGPHHSVMEALIRDRDALIERDADPKIISANDLTILAVAQVITRCEQIIKKDKESIQ